MIIGIFYNEKQADPSVATELKAALRKGGSDAVIMTDEEEIRGIDRLIVLGGDGTILRAARRAAIQSVPLFGVNFGRIGFLTEFERDELSAAVDLALSPDCDVLERAMLGIDWNGNRIDCLNECSLLRGVSPQEENKVVTIGVRIDGSEAGEVTADGLIVSTPTGSTAYSLSAGGSIMAPDCDTFMLTPVCAFSLKSRPIVYPSSSELTFSIRAPHRLLLYGDGRFLGVVGENDSLIVRKASRSAVFLTANKKGYFRRITEKIN